MESSWMLLADKVALITGASRGIGKAIAETFVAHGAAVVLVARTDAVQALAETLRQTGGRATAVQGDVNDEATVRECIKACRGQFGRLDILVNNAGAMPQAVMGMISIEDSRKLFDLNVVSMVNLTQVAARMMKAPASIINLSSIAWRGLVGASVYSATKGAVTAFSLAAAKELGPRGIRVNAIAPGFIDTDLTRGLSEEQRQRTLGSIRMGRIGQAQDIANAALFLASDLSTYVTGQVLGVDGGMQA
jgi:3-oxoacyl-[acyl-carrier protein] reductase